MRWAIATGLVGAAVAAALASCSSFDDGEATTPTPTPTPPADDATTDTGSATDAANDGFGSCAPLGRSIGYFAQFPASAGAEIASLAADGSSGVWMSGFAADIDLGTGAKIHGAFLVKLDDAAKASNVEVVSSPNLVRGRAVLVTANRRYWSVFHENSVTYRDAGFGTTKDGGFASFVAGYGGDGTFTSERFEGSSVFAWELAAVAGEGVFVAGHFTDKLNALGQNVDRRDAGTPQLFAARAWSAAGGTDGVVASDGPGDRIVRAAASDGKNRLHVTGRYTLSAPFDRDAGDADESDAYVATFNGSDLTPVDFARFGGAGAQEGRAIVGLPDGTLVMAAQTSGEMLGPGGSSLGKALGKTDAFVLRLGANLNVAWAYPLGGAEDDAPVAIAHDANGDRVVVLGESKSAKIETRQQSVANPSPGESNTFVAAYGIANGGTATVWAPSGGQGPGAIAVDAKGRVYIAGTFSKTMTAGNLTRTATSDADVYVIRCDP